ncbi:MAG: hypothetical protein OK474_02660 [Thaumarchaeota archaeon]|nr:hypothetical protein [Nitrososphaerota archaeon]
MVLNTVVLWVHILGAIGWLGAVMVFGMVVGPSLPGLSGSTRVEFSARVLPRYARYIEIFSIITLVFGVAMVAVITDGDFSMMSPSTPFGLYISIGAVLSLVPLGLVFAVVIPSAHRIAGMSEALMKTPGPPPPELAAASRRLRMGSMAGMALLILVTIFMVAGATL